MILTDKYSAIFLKLALTLALVSNLFASLKSLVICKQRSLTKTTKLRLSHPRGYSYSS